MRHGKLSTGACLVVVLACAFLSGCIRVTRVEPLHFSVVSDCELETASPFGADGRYERRDIRLSAEQKAEYRRLTGEDPKEVVFFYSAAFHSLVAESSLDNTSGEIFIEQCVADTGPFAYFIYVSDGAVRMVTLREPCTIERKDRLIKMLKGLEDTTLGTLAVKPDNPLTRAIRRVLALHAILSPRDTDPFSRSKPV